MRPVDPVDIDDVELFHAVVDAKRGKRKQRLRRIQRDVFVAYGRYEDRAPDLADLVPTPLTDAQATDLLHCYEVPTAPSVALRSRLLNDEGYVKCCLCSLGESSTLDHYLPKHTYPEFSIFSLNLVPCCARCNSYKNDSISTRGVRSSLHPYFDSLPTDRFLALKTRLRSDALSLRYRVFRPTGMDRHTYERLNSHFSLLKLEDRYRRMGLEDLGSQYRSLERIYGDFQDASSVAKQLATTAGDLEDHYGVNHWRAVLYRSLSEMGEFCDGGFAVLEP